MIFAPGTLTEEHTTAIEDGKDGLTTVKDAAGALGVPAATVRQWVYRNGLPHGFLNGRIAILNSALHARYMCWRHAQTSPTVPETCLASLPMSQFVQADDLCPPFVRPT